MPISTALGLLAALIGSTATLLGAWAYIRAQHPSKQELFRAMFAILIIMICILGLAIFISRATTIKINGQETIPVPNVPVPNVPVPALPVSTAASSPTPSPSPTSAATPSPASTAAPSPTLAPTSNPTLPPTPVSSPAAKPTTKTGRAP